MEEVRRADNHPTADEIYELVRRRLPRISLGTVYRNLDRLSREGVIRTIEGAGSRRYDGDLEEHWHVRCADCGLISDVKPGSDLNLKSGTGFPEGFLVTGWHVEYRGMCGECKEKQGSGARSQESE